MCWRCADIIPPAAGLLRGACWTWCFTMVPPTLGGASGAKEGFGPGRPLAGVREAGVGVPAAPGACLCPEVFRSQDYNALLFAFKQVGASRYDSASLPVILWLGTALNLLI